MSGKLVSLIGLLLAIPLIGTAAVSLGQEDIPSQVTGDVLNCPDGSTVQSEFSLEGDSFTATGLLVSLDAGSVTVAGPSGSVTAAPTVNAQVEAGLQPGMPVEIEGALFDQGTTMVASTVRSACGLQATGTPTASPTESPGPTDTAGPSSPTPTPTPTAEPTPGEEGPTDEQPCNRGPGRAGELHVIIHGNRIDIKRGGLSAVSEGFLSLVTPFGDVQVIVDGDTRIKGDLSAATEVMVKGTIEDAVVHASQVKVLCPQGAHRDDGDGEDDGKSPGPPPSGVLPTPETHGEGDDNHGEAENDGRGRGHDDEDEGDEDDDGGSRGNGHGGGPNPGHGDRGRSNSGHDD